MNNRNAKKEIEHEISSILSMGGIPDKKEQPYLYGLYRGLCIARDIIEERGELRMQALHESINRYKIKNGYTIDDVLKELKKRKIYVNEGNASYINENARYSFSKPLDDDDLIGVCVGFPEDISTWDDIGYVLVLDEDFGQPYMPFYNGKEMFSFLKETIDSYNKFMDSLVFLERKDKE